MVCRQEEQWGGGRARVPGAGWGWRVLSWGKCELSSLLLGVLWLAGGPWACLVHIRRRVSTSGGRWEALGGVTGLPELLLRLAPSHACPFTLLWEEVAGWSGGDTPAALGKPPQALPAKGISGAAEGVCTGTVG